MLWNDFFCLYQDFLEANHQRSIGRNTLYRGKPLGKWVFSQIDDLSKLPNHQKSQLMGIDHFVKTANTKN